MLNILTDLNGSYTALHGGIDLKHPNGSSRIITEHHASNTLKNTQNPNGSSRHSDGV